MRSDEAPGWTGRLLAAAQRRGTFDLYPIDIEAAPRGTPRRTTPA